MKEKTLSSATGRLLGHGQASSIETENAVFLSIEYHQLPVLLLGLVTHLRHPPSRYLVVLVDEAKHGDSFVVLLSHRVGSGSHTQSSPRQEAQ